MKYRTILKAALCMLILAATCLFAVETQVSKKPADVNDAKSDEPAPAANKTADANASEVIIKLGDEDLTMQEVLWRVPNPDPVQIARLAKSWLETELLYAEAERRGITNLPKAKFFADIMRKNAFAQELQRQVVEAVKISDEDVQAYYENNKNIDQELTTRGALSFSHVRTKTQQEAEAVLKKLKAGDNINQLAKNLSVASDAIRGGAVNQQSYTQVRRLFSADFLDRLSAAEEGQLIGPVAVVTPRKAFYEVARKDGEVKPVPLPFDQVKDELKPRLERVAQRAAYQSLLDSLTKAAADRIVKSPTLIEAEKAAPERPQPRAVRPATPMRPTPAPLPIRRK
jgi:parvulin-like peptidyl-prolyl isomerase